MSDDTVKRALTKAAASIASRPPELRGSFPLPAIERNQSWEGVPADVIATAKGISTNFRVQIDIARAIMAERERCAKIVDTTFGDDDTNPLWDAASDAFNAGAHVTMSERLKAMGAVIAAAIRG